MAWYKFRWNDYLTLADDQWTHSLGTSWCKVVPAERKEVMPDVSFDWLQLRVLPSEVPAHVARRSGVDSDTRSVQ